MLQPHPQPRVEKGKPHELVTTVTPFHPAFPHANGFNGFLRALPGESGFVATIPSATRKRCRRVNASVEASGPHDFAVRRPRRSSSAQPRPPHPAPNVRDDSRNAPLTMGTGRASYGCDFSETRREIFFGRGVDRWNRVDRASEIRFLE